MASSLHLNGTISTGCCPHLLTAPQAATPDLSLSFNGPQRVPCPNSMGTDFFIASLQAFVQVALP